MKKILIISSLIFLLLPFSSAKAETITQRLKGYILLQVESKGEAWYVNPTDGKRYYLKDGDDAYQLLKKLGLGAKDRDLNKIPVGLEERFKDVDSDADGLPDKLEEAIGTDAKRADTDGDGYSDIAEVKAGYDPLSRLKLQFDQKLANQLKGKILLQVETRGQAWYINPKDGKRYYLKDGEAAYQIMRYLSLGITDKDLAQIPANIVTDSGLEAVKLSFDKIKEATLAGNKDLLLDYVTQKSREFLADWTVSKKIANLEFIKAVFENGNYVVNSKTTFTNGRTEEYDTLFIRENNIWKEGTMESLERSANLYEKEKQAAEASQPAEGKVDFIITDIKVYPQPPKVNSEDTEAEIYVKNIGTKTAVEGVSLQLQLSDSSEMPKDLTLIDLIRPGETVVASVDLYNISAQELFQRKDQPGIKNISVKIDDLNTPMDDVTTNNTLTKSFTFIE